MKSNDQDYFDLFSHTPEEFKAHLEAQIKKKCEEAAEECRQEHLLWVEQKKVDVGLSRIQ